MKDIKRIGRDYNQKPSDNLRPLVGYICRRNENKLIELLERNDIDTGNNRSDVVEAAMFWLGKKAKKNEFKEAITALYKIHPDKAGIIEVIELQKAQKPKATDTSNFDGDPATPTTPKEEKLTEKPIFRFGVLIVVVILLFIIISKVGD